METARPFSSGEALQVKKPIRNSHTKSSPPPFTEGGDGGIFHLAPRTVNGSFAGNLGVSNGDAQRQASLHIKLCRGHQEIVMQVDRREGETRPLKECPGLPPTARRPLINNRLQRMGN